ncbi:MAG: head-tail connector protein [Nitratireductor sp.]
MIRTLIEPPALLPVSVAEIKAHMRIDGTDEDAYLADLAAAATSHVEARTGAALITQTWRVFLDDWPDAVIIALPLRPVRSITAIRVYDSEGNGVEPAPGTFVLDAASEPARLHITDRHAPSRPVNGIEIDVVAGFGDTAVEVPDTLRRAILVLAAFWFEVRGSATDAAALGMEPNGFDRLIRPWRRIGL